MTTEMSDPISAKWDGDYLDRVEVAKFLTIYLNNIYLEDNPNLNTGHFVLNINATWGHGKTFLLKRWAADLTQSRYPVVMFDAWENDFSKDPLVGFISELYTSLDPWLKQVAPAKAAMKKVMQSAKKIIGVGVGVFAGAAAAGLAEAGLDLLEGSLDVSDKKTERIGDSVSENAGRLADKALKEHKVTKEAIAEFKRNLAELIKAIEDSQDGINLPLYIFIDELDRCRPTYAIELLENIKHLFGVKGVFFIVATNKEQLSHSIKAVYGNAFDANGYLGRFFDQEYTLPEPDNKRYAKYVLEEKYNVINAGNASRFYSPLLKQKGTNDHVTNLFAYFSDAFGVPLRDQGQIAHRLKAIMLVYHKPSCPTIYLDYLLFLLMLKRKDEEAFNQLTQMKRRLEPGDFTMIVERNLKQTTIEIPSDSNVRLGKGAETKRISTLISDYHSIAAKTCRKVMEDFNTSNNMTTLENMFFSEAIDNLNNQKNNSYLSIADYPKLVLQVGHLEN